MKYVRWQSNVGFTGPFWGGVHNALADVGRYTWTDKEFRCLSAWADGAKNLSALPFGVERLVLL